MPIIQETFDVPPDIMAKINAGMYRRTGGVVRHAVGPQKGQIVKLLEPIAKTTQGSAARALRLATNYMMTPTGIFVCVTVGVCISGVVIFRVHHEMRMRSAEKSFHANLNAYLDALNNGNLETSQIDKLIFSLDELKKNPYFKKRGVKLSLEDLDAIVTLLAQNNSAPLTNIEDKGVSKSESIIINLQRYLQTQKRMFDEVA